MLGQRLLRWTNIKVTSSKCIVFVPWQYTKEFYMIQRAWYSETGYAGSLLGRRHRRWANNVPTLGQHLVSGGIPPYFNTRTFPWRHMLIMRHSRDVTCWLWDILVTSHADYGIALWRRIPADKRCWINVGLTLVHRIRRWPNVKPLVHRLRRWPNVKPTLIEHHMSAGMLINWVDNYVAVSAPSQYQGIDDKSRKLPSHVNYSRSLALSYGRIFPAGGSVRNGRIR